MKEKIKDWQLIQALNVAKDIINSGQDLVPMIIGYTDTGHMLFPGFYKTDKEKESYLSMVSTCFLIYKVNYYISISEGWMGTSLNVRPSEDPNRKDVLFAMCVSRNEKRMITYEVVIADGKKELKEYQSATDVEGVFAELLPPEDAVLPEETRQQLMRKMEELGLMVKPTDDDTPPNTTIQ